ncbi:MAG: matrixin family metalloprotease [bacterium]
MRSLLTVSLVLVCLAAWATSPRDFDDVARLRMADGVCAGTVLGWRMHADADGLRYTETAVRVDETIKGRFPQTIRIIQRAGRSADELEEDCGYIALKPGSELVLFLARGDSHGAKLRGGAGDVREIPQNRTARRLLIDRLKHLSVPGPDITFPDEEMTYGYGLDGFFTNSANGAGSRFPIVDEGLPVPVVIDMQALPAGITSNQALAVVQNALEAWQELSSLRFTNESFTSFTTNVQAITNRGGKIYVQLHDLYGGVPDGFLGWGGRTFTTNSSFPDGGTGGCVGTNAFDLSIRGYAMIEHTNVLMETPSYLEEVLTHELGHALGLAHISDTNAIMFATADLDGLGAVLGTSDVTHIRWAYDPSNTPPYMYTRVMEVLTDDVITQLTNVNSIEVRGYDLHGEALTYSLTNMPFLNGGWLFDGVTLIYTARFVFADTYRDPVTGSALDRLDLIVSDGVNASPPVRVKVHRFSRDQSPATADGLPDYWMSNYFGHVDPQAGDLSQAGDDADGDGVVNLDEFLQGTDPTNANSLFAITGPMSTSIQWTARAHHVYELQTAESVTGPFMRISNPAIPTNEDGDISIDPPSATSLFYRLEKVK